MTWALYPNSTGLSMRPLRIGRVSPSCRLTSRIAPSRTSPASRDRAWAPAPGDDLRPGVPPCRVHLGGDLAPGAVPAGGLPQRAPYGRDRRDRTEQLPLVAHHPEVADHPGAVGDGAGQVGEDPALVQAGIRRWQRRRQAGRQAVRSAS
jgi:hypothetical protein